MALPLAWADLPDTGLRAKPVGVRLQIGLTLVLLARDLAEQFQQERVQEEKTGMVVTLDARPREWGGPWNRAGSPR